MGTEVISPKACAVGASAMAQCRSGLSDATVERTWSSGDSTASARMAMLSPCWRLSSPSHSRVDAAGRAPGGPELDQDDAIGELVRGERMAGKIGELERGEESEFAGGASMRTGVRC